MRKTFKSIVLADLKKNNLDHLIPKIKSITYENYSGGSSLNIKTLDLFKSERTKLELFIDRYSQGSFNGMIDLYEHSENTHNVERRAKYVFLRNDFSDTIKKIISFKLKKQGIETNEQAMKMRNVWLDTLIHRELCELESFEQLEEIIK